MKRVFVSPERTRQLPLGRHGGGARPESFVLSVPRRHLGGIGSLASAMGAIADAINENGKSE
jgi:hypothetical protein